MTKTGIVKKMENGFVIVSVKREGACGENCASCAGCSKMMEVKSKCDLIVKVGDSVTVSSDSGYVFLGLVVLFLIPIVIPIAMYLAFINVSKLAAVLLTVVSAAVSLLVVFLVSKNKKFIEKLTPKVISVIK